MPRYFPFCQQQLTPIARLMSSRPTAVRPIFHQNTYHGAPPKPTTRSSISLWWVRGGLIACMMTMFLVNFFVNFPSVIANIPLEDESIYTKEMQLILNTKRLSPPLQWPPEKGSKEECLYTRDYGLLERLTNSSQSFCTGASDLDWVSSNKSPFTFYSVPESSLRATQLSNFVLDMRGAKVSRDIDSLVHDGIDHDPRFTYKPESATCACVDTQDSVHGVPNIWVSHFTGTPGETDPICQTSSNMSEDNILTLRRAVIVSRRDDHNPFFQISGIFNAWIMMNVVGWDRGSTQLVTLDRGLPSPVDELRHAVLGPKHPVIGGEVFQNHAVRFESALLAPSEASGTLMQHLDDRQPCYANTMLADFRDLALKSMDVTPQLAKIDPRRCLVTVISRRPYGGRRVQRVWQNEEEILHLMREDYKGAYRFGECEFQALDFVNMTMHDQMRVMVDSDVVIGMHGAGMVNIMWTRPETLVVEIFPRQRYRWGYRNLCQFLGCSWHQFRGGNDVLVRTYDPNDVDKNIQYSGWKTFFDPLFRDAIGRLENSTGRPSILG